MNAASLPRRLFSWVYRWWRQRVAPRRRPITHPCKLTLEALEQRSAPTNLALASSAELAPPQLAELDSLMRPPSGERSWDANAAEKKRLPCWNRGV